MLWNKSRSRNILKSGTAACTSIALIAALALSAAGLSASPAGQSDDPFKQVWERTDLPVAQGRAQRSWLWGPTPFATLTEPMEGAPGGVRRAQYYDKARMEINNPRSDPSSPWYVTNGLLVYEMISGRVQVGPDKFETKAPAQVLVAGEAPITMNPVNFTPTYAVMGKVATLAGTQNRASSRLGAEVREVLQADGNVADGPPAGIKSFPKLQHYDSTLGHNIPDVFWSFMNSRGLVYENGQYRDARLFDWVYVMGYPLTEPYWVQTYIGGKPATVMVQAFQRRVLTYNPTNPAEWRVEMGNAGSQYYSWRYEGKSPPVTAPTPPAGGAQITARRIDADGLLASRQYSAIEEPLHAALTTQSQWNDLWTRHTAKLDAFLPPPQVDFSREFVVAAFWGNRPDGCNRLNIESVTRKGDTIYVVVNRFVVEGGCTTVITQPHDFAAVSRAGLAAGKYNVVFADPNMKELARTEIKF